MASVPKGGCWWTVGVERRAFSVEVKNSEKIKVDGRSRTETTDDKLAIEVQTKNGELKVEVAYKHKAEDAADASVKFESRILEIVEFVPSSPELGYQPGVDQVSRVS